MTTSAIGPARAQVMEFSAEMAARERGRLALADIQAGWRLRALAWKLAWLDIKLRYRGSMLGPFWLTISTAVMVASLGVLYATLFHMSLREYLPFLALGQVLWAFLASLVAESCTAFTEAEPIIRSARVPFFVFAMRVLLRNLVVLAHNVLVFVVVFLFLDVEPGWNALAALPGLMLWAINALALTLLLGAFCARFRDIPPIVNSLMQIGFFVTPIIWKPEQIGEARAWLPLSPFYDMLEIVRSPLLGDPPDPLTWAGALGWTAVLLMVTWLFFRKVRGRIAFWI